MMSVDIHLRSGLVFRDAPAMLVEKFREWPWGRYDGDPPHDPNTIDPGRDVDRVYRLGIRASRNALVNMVRVNGTRLSECLHRLPTNVALEDADLQKLREPIIELFDAASAKHVKIAGATKLLFPFRPRLLAVIDSIVEDYYWFATSIRDEPAFRVLAAVESFGEYVFELLRLMQADVAGARDEIDAVLAECSAHPFASASRVRVIESLIWHYYARGGSTRPARHFRAGDSARSEASSR